MVRVHLRGRKDKKREPQKRKKDKVVFATAAKKTSKILLFLWRKDSIDMSFTTHAHSIRISQPTTTRRRTANTSSLSVRASASSQRNSFTTFSSSFYQRHKNRNQSKTTTTTFLINKRSFARDSIVSKAIEVEDEDDDNSASDAIEVEDEDENDSMSDTEVVEGEEDSEGADESSSLKESQFTSYFAELMENSDNDVDMLAKFQTEVMALEKSVKDMEAQVQGEQDQKAAIQDQYVRSVADFQNFQKRTAKEKADLAPAVKSKMIEAMLPVLDNFDLTAKNVKGENEGEEKIIKGYHLLHKQLLETLEAEGLKVVPGEGEPFDPNMHEAIMREESEDVAEDHIMEEFRKGYLVGEKLVRASMVKVSSGKP